MSARLPRGLDPITVAVVGVTGLLFLFAPLIFSDFFVSVILTKALWLGIAAASLIFLSSYAGMVSLGSGRPLRSRGLHDGQPGGGRRRP